MISRFKKSFWGLPLNISVFHNSNNAMGGGGGAVTHKDHVKIKYFCEKKYNLGFVQLDTCIKCKGA
jgi:hypothetical protein